MNNIARPLGRGDRLPPATANVERVQELKDRAWFLGQQRLLKLEESRQEQKRYKLLCLVTIHLAQLGREIGREPEPDPLGPPHYDIARTGVMLWKR